MNKKALINQLLSMRAAIDAALDILEEEAQKKKEGCPHCGGKQEDASTMGVTRLVCMKCGHIEEVS